jgi:hypothetical protein
MQRPADNMSRRPTEDTAQHPQEPQATYCRSCLPCRAPLRADGRCDHPSCPGHALVGSNRLPGALSGFLRGSRVLGLALVWALPLGAVEAAVWVARVVA